MEKQAHITSPEAISASNPSSLNRRLLRLSLFLLTVLNVSLFAEYMSKPCGHSDLEMSDERNVLGSKDYHMLRQKQRYARESVKIPEIILNNGVLMPKLAAGTGNYDADEAEDAVYKALSVGYTHIDTAHNYRNQAGVRKGMKRFLEENPDTSRNDLFITTKVPGCGSSGVSYDDCGDDTRVVIADNLKRLNLSHVDLLLVHSSPIGDKVREGCGKDNCYAMRHQWKAMQHAFLNKKARSIGISNFCKDCIDCILDWSETTVLPSVNQIQYHIGMGRDPGGLVSYSKENGMVVQAYSPLANNDKDIMIGHGFKSICRKYHKSPPEVALNWIIQQNVSFVIRSDKKKHLEQNVEAFQWKLESDALEFLDDLTEPYSSPSFSCSDD